MQLNHTVPYDEVNLVGFALVKHSATSAIYLSIKDFDLVCNPHEILGLKLEFAKIYAEYGISYTKHRGIVGPSINWTFESAGSVLQIIHQLSRNREWDDGTNIYLFRFETDLGTSPVPIPQNCPPPPTVDTPGLRPKLIAVLLKA